MAVINAFQDGIVGSKLCDYGQCRGDLGLEAHGFHRKALFCGIGGVIFSEVNKLLRWMESPALHMMNGGPI